MIQDYVAMWVKHDKKHPYFIFTEDKTTTEWGDTGEQVRVAEVEKYGRRKFKNLPDISRLSSGIFMNSKAYAIFEKHHVYYGDGQMEKVALRDRDIHNDGYFLSIQTLEEIIDLDSSEFADEDLQEELNRIVFDENELKNLQKYGFIRPDAVYFEGCYLISRPLLAELEEAGITGFLYCEIDDWTHEIPYEEMK